MSHDLRWLAPTPPDPEYEILQAGQYTWEFYEEVRYRQEFERYCQWYYATAAQHRQEHEKLKNDFNFMGWFRRQ
ncbi:MAG: hypothetical protein NW220_19560 [Leptolyngbyaceae cyanobacterium bins.349]|nr:hypothetical protein [Leptolyngbyaceae cyanobacterium bins.349]